ncbi:3-deoxy-D-manno-octulosonic acid transferase [Algivirga pacifica]|uniref:3-deoxy-D-manno-octulosonic acid transferase n=1 Tax=Algivirga pacifica TaxID=1162670 RepID=A0ABP9CWY0_9BACT
MAFLIGKWSYALGIIMYRWVLGIISPFHKKAKLFVKGRKGQITALESFFQGNKQRVVWVHCASLGEFEQGRPIIEALKQQAPDIKILLTFYSPSGYEVRKDYPYADYCTYMPLDTPSNAREFIEVVNPSLAIFVKYEFWYYHLRELKEREIPVFSVSSIFRQDQVYFKPHALFYRKTLELISHFYVQDKTSGALLSSIGIDRWDVAGDSRFDRVIELVEQRKDIPIVQKFTQQTFTLVIGSSWTKDLKHIAPLLNAWEEPLKLIIAPHEIEERSLQETEAFFPDKQIIRFSAMNEGADWRGADILLIDNIGMLTSLYQYGSLAYIGGAFGKGLHNILEAATYGIPVIFGPKYDKFNEAKEIIASKGGFSIDGEEAFEKIFVALYHDEIKRLRAGKQAEMYVQSKVGATEKVLEAIQLRKIQ